MTRKASSQVQALVSRKKTKELRPGRPPQPPSPGPSCLERSWVYAHGARPWATDSPNQQGILQKDTLRWYTPTLLQEEPHKHRQASGTVATHWGWGRADRPVERVQGDDVPDGLHDLSSQCLVSRRPCGSLGHRGTVPTWPWPRTPAAQEQSPDAQVTGTGTQAVKAKTNACLPRLH